MGINVPEQVYYWRKGSEEDFAAARALLEKGHVRHAMFFAHLSLEKMLKSLVCRATNGLAPKSHNLVILARRTGSSVEQDMMEFLADMDRFNLAGRYPDARTPSLPEADANALMSKVAEVLECLRQQ